MCHVFLPSRSVSPIFLLSSSRPTGELAVITVIGVPLMSSSSPPRVGPMKYTFLAELWDKVTRLPTVAKGVGC